MIILRHFTSSCCSKESERRWWFVKGDGVGESECQQSTHGSAGGLVNSENDEMGPSGKLLLVCWPSEDDAECRPNSKWYCDSKLG